MITVFELLKKKMISRITVFVKHTILDISLTEKLNSFLHKRYFGHFFYFFSISNIQFVIAVFEFLKEKMISRTTIFAKHTILDINLTEKLNSFLHKHYFGLNFFLTE